jgi:hypothetical protein
VGGIVLIFLARGIFIRVLEKGIYQIKLKA